MSWGERSTPAQLSALVPWCAGQAEPLLFLHCQLKPLHPKGVHKHALCRVMETLHFEMQSDVAAPGTGVGKRVGLALSSGIDQSTRTFHPGFKGDWKSPICCGVKPSTNSLLFFLTNSLGGSPVSHLTWRDTETSFHLPGKDAPLVSHPQMLLCLPHLLISLTGLL